ncbi:hypothetical protein VTH06DRAFT_3010 [Thermothelomyces fergusii]
MRRPLVYDSGPQLGMIHDDPVRRSPSYRVLKSQPAEPIAPRFLERGLASDANVHPAPLSMAPTRSPEEPVAYLTIGLEFSRASPSFLSAIGRSSVTGVDFESVLVAEDRPRASRLRQQVQDKREEEVPVYLPPIFNDWKAVMQSLSFAPEEVSRYPLHWRDTFTFLGDDGHARPIWVRAGLASRDSIYFIFLLLDRAGQQPSYPVLSSSSLRDLGSSLDRGLQPYPSQPTPPSVTFDRRQSRLSDAGHHDPRQTIQPTGFSSLHMLPVRSQSLLSSPYSVSPGRTDYPIASRAYQISRTEAHASGRPSQQPTDHPLSLPRIRSPPLISSQQRELPRTQQPLPPPPPPAPPPLHPPSPRAAAPPYQGREERSRIEIGGLIEQPELRESPQR